MVKCLIEIWHHPKFNQTLERRIYKEMSKANRDTKKCKATIPLHSSLSFVDTGDRAGIVENRDGLYSSVINSQ